MYQVLSHLVENIAQVQKTNSNKKLIQYKTAGWTGKGPSRTNMEGGGGVVQQT